MCLNFAAGEIPRCAGRVGAAENLEPTGAAGVPTFLLVRTREASWSAAARRRLGMNNTDGDDQGSGRAGLALTGGKGGVEPPHSKVPSAQPLSRWSESLGGFGVVGGSTLLETKTVLPSYNAPLTCTIFPYARGPRISGSGFMGSAWKPASAGPEPIPEEKFGATRILSLRRRWRSTAFILCPKMILRLATG